MVAYLVANELVTDDMLVEHSYRGLLESHIYPARRNYSLKIPFFSSYTYI